MRYRCNRFVLVVAALIVAAHAPLSLQAQVGAKSGRPKTVHDLILEFGVPTKKVAQLKLKLEGTVVADKLGTMPETVQIDLFYDKATHRIRVVNNSVFQNGSEKKVTTLATKARALIWTDRIAPKGEPTPTMKVEAVGASQALPNPWRLPIKLAYSGLFADALHGYEAFGREYARSAPINREPDERGLRWFELKPAPGAAPAMRYEFNAGLQVKAGFAAEEGWIKELVVSYPKSSAVMTLRVVEQATKLSEADLAGFEIPERVLTAWENRVVAKPPSGKPSSDKPARPKFGPLRRLEKDEAKKSPDAAGGEG